ncbi:hypothetical protein [Tengunoibacter tsumagoiensis]|uniref:UspA domain-containing protein n=1 Tax=Tengunoibacter tsumagoiensis TaxID=2014871 RepID=A0A402AAX7_9CHLR|nr:hypothetical protein [Tengunoibacter tsumagoiensis]GCE16196.1 hypothetical protein KTT_60550 [Tengunoibacter tsumagoiensis]
MNNLRLLLPFTHGIDAPALDQALSLARQQHATLVLLALLPEIKGQHIRLEALQQLQDLRIYAQQRALRYHLKLEYIQAHTQNSNRTIIYTYQEQMCSAILLFMRSGQGVLLKNEELQDLITQRQAHFYLFRLPEGAVKTFMQRLQGRIKGVTTSQVNMLQIEILMPLQQRERQIQEI